MCKNIPHGYTMESLCRTLDTLDVERYVAESKRVDSNACPRACFGVIKTIYRKLHVSGPRRNIKSIVIKSFLNRIKFKFP